MGLAKFVVDMPGDAVEYTGELTAKVISGAADLTGSDAVSEAGDSVAGAVVASTGFVAGALHLPGDALGALEDALPDPTATDAVATDQSELT